jgi:phage baseplate assembly protein W
MPIPFLSPRAKKIPIYRDLHKDMTKSPVNDDLAVKIDEEAVKESIKNLILTDKGERLMQPLLGGSIRAMLFDNNTPATLKLIQEQVRETIEQYEPRATIIDVQVTSQIDDNVVRVTIFFYINNVEQPISVSVLLERIR